MTKRRRGRLPPILTLHGMDSVKWAKRWGIQIPDPPPCYHCGALLPLDLPFVKGAFRGLTARECKCGGHGESSRPPYCIVRADGRDIFAGGDLTGRK